MTSDYQPKPLEVDHVTLHGELIQLAELLAENAHDLWAQQRLIDGWSYGTERCDKSRRHPCLVPYAQLPETEKEYDRKVAFGTIRAVLALGFVISKRGED